MHNKWITDPSTSSCSESALKRKVTFSEITHLHHWYLSQVSEKLRIHFLVTDTHSGLLPVFGHHLNKQEQLSNHIFHYLSWAAALVIPQQTSPVALDSWRSGVKPSPSLSYMCQKDEKSVTSMASKGTMLDIIFRWLFVIELECSHLTTNKLKTSIPVKSYLSCCSQPPAKSLTFISLIQVMLCCEFHIFGRD